VDALSGWVDNFSGRFIAAKIVSKNTRTARKSTLCLFSLDADFFVVKCFCFLVLQPKYALMPLQTSTHRPYNLPYRLDDRESYGGISVIPPRTRTKIQRSVSLPPLS
jgi:hypothetical protein